MTWIAEHAGLANWPALVMLAGVVVLGVLAAVLIRDRVRANQELQSTREHDALHRAETLYEQSEQARHRASELIDSASNYAERFHNQTAQLERMLIEVEQKLAAIERIEQQTRRKPTATPPAAETIESKPARAPSPSRRAPEPNDPMARRVYEMADAGRPVSEIASVLNEHIGKVELILALREM